jgi:hypothetical protein
MLSFCERVWFLSRIVWGHYTLKKNGRLQVTSPHARPFYFYSPAVLNPSAAKQTRTSETRSPKTI